MTRDKGAISWERLPGAESRPGAGALAHGTLLGLSLTNRLDSITTRPC